MFNLNNYKVTYAAVCTNRVLNKFYGKAISESKKITTYEINKILGLLMSSAIL